MNSRERVRLALEHREADRVPIDLGGSIVSSISRSSYVAVKRHLGLPVEEIAILDEIQQLPYLGEDLLERFGVDVRLVQLPPATAPGGQVIDEGDYYALFDRWGAKLRMPKESGFYFDWAEYPIKAVSDEELDRYAWPEPDPIELVRRLGEQARLLHETTDYALVGSGVIGGGLFEQPCRLVGLENFLMALLTDRRWAERLMDRILEIYVESCDRYLAAVGEYIDVFTYWDDVAGQDGWLISPELYVTAIKPRQRSLIEAIKRRTKAKIFYHGCGAVFDLIPHLLDIGVDIINPVQVSARGMDTKRLKAAYGKDITFWGGGVDTQRVLPFGTSAEVRDEVQRRIDDLAPGGGFVFAAVHNIQALVPPQNIVVAYDTALDYGRYGLRPAAPPPTPTQPQLTTQPQPSPRRTFHD
jgi:uroporphyrinogen decarboxylase